MMKILGIEERSNERGNFFYIIHYNADKKKKKIKLKIKDLRKRENKEWRKIIANYYSE